MDCYEFMNSPAFFYEEGSCQEVNHDLRVTGGDLTSNINELMSAVLIQLNSNSADDVQGGGWAGDQFLRFPLGSRLWTLNGAASQDDLVVKADEMIRDALEPLIDQGLISSIRVEPVRTIDGVESRVTIFQSDVPIFETVVT